MQTADIRVSPFQDPNDNCGTTSPKFDKQEFQSLLEMKASKSSIESCMSYIDILHS